MNKEELNELYSAAFEDSTIQSQAIKDYIGQLQQENIHYKNILNELESWLEEKISKFEEKINIFYETYIDKNYPNLEIKLECYQKYLDKLKELKESDNNV